MSKLKVRTDWSDHCKVEKAEPERQILVMVHGSVNCLTTLPFYPTFDHCSGLWIRSARTQLGYYVCNSRVMLPCEWLAHDELHKSI